MGQWVMGQMGHHFWMGHVGHPLTNDDEITAQYIACNFFSFLVDIKQLLTHSISPIIIAGGLILICDFLLSRS